MPVTLPADHRRRSRSRRSTRAARPTRCRGHRLAKTKLDVDAGQGDGRQGHHRRGQGRRASHAGETVTVDGRDKKVKATAKANGKAKVKVPATKTGKTKVKVVGAFKNRKGKATLTVTA